MTDTGSDEILSDSAQHDLAATRDSFFSRRIVWWPGGNRCVFLQEEEATLWGVKEGDLVLNGVPVLIDDTPTVPNAKSPDDTVPDL